MAFRERIPFQLPVFLIRDLFFREILYLFGFLRGKSHGSPYPLIFGTGWLKNFHGDADSLSVHPQWDWISMKPWQFNQQNPGMR